MATCDMSNNDSQSIVWNVRCFSDSFCIECKPITIGDLKFTLFLEKISEGDPSQDYYTLSIKSDADDFVLVPDKTLYVSVYIKDKRDIICFPQFTEIDMFETKTSIWKVMLQDLLASEQGPNAKSKDDDLKIVCLIDPNNFHQENIMEQVAPNDIRPCLYKRSSEYKNLLSNKEYTDIVLKCGDWFFPAHKAILSARSHVFAAIIGTENEEIVVDDINIDILDTFLNYIYSGNLRDIPQNLVRHLYEAAKKYAVKDLEKRLEK